MKVLMFGWEFPPKIYGGLAVASYGITKGLSLQGDVETTFCMPKPCGDEEKFLKIINMSTSRIGSSVIRQRITTVSATISTPISTICRDWMIWDAWALPEDIQAISMTR